MFYEFFGLFQTKLNLSAEKLAHEWRTAPIEIDGLLKTRILSMSLEGAWGEISSLRNFRDELIFPELSKLAVCVMSLPHSNAEAERIFSVVTDEKSKKRNKMGIDNLNAITVV